MNVLQRSTHQRGISNTHHLCSQSRAIIARLETLGQHLQDPHGRVVDQKFWFVSAYIHSSKHILRKVEHGDYQHPATILTIQKYFFQLYQHNLNHPEPHWQRAFQRCQQIRSHQPSFFQVMHVFYPQVVAHVRFDLPRAILWACQETGLDVPELAADFMETLHGFDQAVEAFMQDVRHRAGLCPPCPPGLVQVMTWLLQRERQLGWQTALMLSQSPDAAGSPLHFLPLDLQ